MKINVHDKFKSWRDFLNLAKRLYKILDSHNLELRSITAYISVESKDTHKLTSLYVVDEDKDYREEVGFDIGYFEWEESQHDEMMIQCKPESELMNQAAYKYTRSRFQTQLRREEREKEDAVVLQSFENDYLPVRSLTKKSGIRKEDFNTVKQLEKKGYDWKKVKIAIDEGKCYKEYRWKSLKAGGDLNDRN